VPHQATAGDRWVCLDVGETLIDETRVWTTWAHLIGVTPLTFMAVLGVVVAEGIDHGETFVRLGFPRWRERHAEFAREFGGFRSDDLYPDALPALQALRAAGYCLAIVANQPASRTAELRALGFDVDLMAMSDEFGFHKPSPEFYSHALQMMGSPDPSSVAYVGDRLDNDVNPAAAAGMRPIWVRRGPWAALGPGAPGSGTLVVNSLSEVVDRIGECWT
jgi:HAD superfamily hydrolase (TIGR01662 family)